MTLSYNDGKTRSHHKRCKTFNNNDIQRQWTF